MKRREAVKIISALVALVVTLLGYGVCAEAQQPAKMPKIGWLSRNSASSPPSMFLAVQRDLQARGYVEGKNIAFEFRYADNNPDRLPGLADELVGLKVDVFLTGGPPDALACKTATRTIPIVFTNVADPVALGLVDSLARPGGNITGFTIISEVLAAKRLELLKETVPKLSRVAMLWNPQNPGNTQQWKESQLAARALGLQLHSMEVSSADKFESAFKEAVKALSGALAIAQDPLVNSHIKLIADLAIKNRLAAMYTLGQFVESGGLMSYGADQAEQARRVAVMVDKILKGAKPADVPVEQPTKFELVINLKTAKTLGLTIPPTMLTRAQRVVK
jgi:putative ABC transport system substrate-binding protein